MASPEEDAASTGWEAPDVVGVLIVIGIVYFIFSRCFHTPTSAERIAGLRTFFSVLDTDDSGFVDKDEFAEAIEGERELRTACAGATKAQFLADLRRLDTEKKNKITWYEVRRLRERRLSNTDPFPALRWTLLFAWPACSSSHLWTSV